MKSIVFNILLYSGITAGLLQRQTSSGCCFQLVSVGDLNAIVEEDGHGDLLVGGKSQDGGFCLDPTYRAIIGNHGRSFFIQDTSQQFGCFNSTTGTLTSFDITAPDIYRRSYLEYGNGTQVFHACPAGSANDQGYYIYADSKPDKTGCFEINLQLGNQSAGCDAQRTSTAGAAPMSTPPPMTIITTPAAQTDVREPVTQIGVERAVATSASETNAPSQSCNIAPSAPSLVPVQVGQPDAGAPGGIRDSEGEVSISPDNSTVFRYSIPPSFADASDGGDGDSSGAPPRQLCALQFRMPVCADLPAGYPCYHFSGLEQETLSNSGMSFALENGDGSAQVAWDDTALHQIEPGQNSIVGTFECGDGGREIAWTATSVRNFSLEFLQAGVGDGSQFQDGVGAWIVPCL